RARGAPRPRGGRPVRVLRHHAVLLRDLADGGRASRAHARAVVLRQSPHAVERGRSLGRVSAALRRVDPAVPRQRIRDRGPDRAPAGARRGDRVHGLRHPRVGPRLPGRADLEGAEGADVTKAIAALVAICALVAAAVFRGSPPVVARDPRPNVLLVLTDDQTLDTMTSDPPAMP